MSSLSCQNQKCLKPATTSCGKCRGIPERDLIGTYSVPYCSNACIEADLEAHEPLCSIRRDHRALFRMMALLREVFYVYREHTFDRVIESWVEGRPGTDKFDVSIKEGVYEEPVIMQDLVRPFPESLATRKDLRDAVLAYLAPNATGLMHDLVEYAFKDMELDILEHKITLENDQKSRVVLRSKDNDILKLRIYPTVYEITTKDGRKYVFDLTAARDESPQNVKDCVEWSKWLSNRTALKITVTPFGSRKTDVGNLPESPAIQFLLTLVDTLAAEVVYSAIKELEQDDNLGMSLHSICMDLDETVYDKKVTELLVGIANRLEFHHSRARIEQEEETAENPLMAEARQEGMSITTAKAKDQVPEEDPPTISKYQRTSRYQRFQQGGRPSDESIKPATGDQQAESTYKVEEREVQGDDYEKDEGQPGQKEEDQELQRRKWKSVKAFLRRVFRRQGMSS